MWKKRVMGRISGKMAGEERAFWRGSRKQRPVNRRGVPVNCCVSFFLSFFLSAFDLAGTLQSDSQWTVGDGDIVERCLPPNGKVVTAFLSLSAPLPSFPLFLRQRQRFRREGETGTGYLARGNYLIRPRQLQARSTHFPRSTSGRYVTDAPSA